MLARFFQRRETEAEPSPAEPVDLQDIATESGFAERYLYKIDDRRSGKLIRDAKRNRHKRREDREGCCAVAQLTVPARDLDIDGLILEAAPNGLTFRPASHYILWRTGEHVQVFFEDVRKNGVIRSTRPDGYGIELFTPFSDDEIEAIQAASVDIGI